MSENVIRAGLVFFAASNAFVVAVNPSHWINWAAVIACSVALIARTR
jgi:hypothetical protein